LGDLERRNDEVERGLKKKPGGQQGKHWGEKKNLPGPELGKLKRVKAKSTCKGGTGHAEKFGSEGGAACDRGGETKKKETQSECKGIPSSLTGKGSVVRGLKPRRGRAGI